MNRGALAFALALGLAAAASRPAAAQTAAAQTAAAGPATSAPEPAPPPAPHKRSRAHFSGKRLAIEMLAGALGGSLVSVATYEALGGDSVGAAVGAIGANFVATPLIEYGVGRGMGGHGSLTWTYLGGLAGFTATGAPPAVTLAVAVIALPITSAIMFEASSSVWARNHDLELSVAPTNGGAAASLSFDY